LVDTDQSGYSVGTFIGQNQFTLMSPARFYSISVQRLWRCANLSNYLKIKENVQLTLKYVSVKQQLQLQLNLKQTFGPFRCPESKMWDFFSVGMYKTVNKMQMA
jgi:hypothetical protein